MVCPTIRKWITGHLPLARSGVERLLVKIDELPGSGDRFVETNGTDIGDGGGHYGRIYHE